MTQALGAVHAPTAARARQQIKLLLDAARDGRTATIRRESQGVALVDSERLRRTLELLVTVAPVVVREGGEWDAYLPGLPISATGATLEAVVDDLVLAVREYADDWNARLYAAPNHADAWGFVQLVGLSDDRQLRAWLTRETA
ncbi:prevent-host-death protein [Cellulomonas sp. SLBN-39]|uniref:prevent-host-death protein n=1 Tax=Cellulomonas sp. SLBN-39 TaxID=2768446 RepID=UPI0011541CB6|nr:prevent-host-death protein [Cellulomonas sp. SLBN-39]TQL01538.1 hypothetical protein FBY24_0593 [Cellulomonas sp. SLBN-39]